jgi:hypothetical protein
VRLERPWLPWEISALAMAVIGGLITSTLLSLLMIPSVFSVMDDFEKFLGRVKRWVRREKPTVDAKDLQAV